MIIIASERSNGAMVTVRELLHHVADLDNSNGKQKRHES